MRKILISLALIFSIVIFLGCSKKTQVDKNEKGKFVFSGSVWKSVDGGIKWEVKNKGEGKANTTEISILNFIINKNDKNNIYMGLARGGILETTDGGETWRFMNFKGEKVYGLALDSINKKIYASGVWQGRGKIFKTEDNGQNWKEIYTSPTNGPLIVSLAVDNLNPNIIYANTSLKETLKSENGGVSWRNIYTSSAPIVKIIIDSNDSNLMYFLNNQGGILKSIDGGNNFVEINVDKSALGFNQGKFNILEVDPSRSGHIYLAGSGGIALSTDAGETWRSILTLNNPTTFPIKALAVNPKNPKEIIYAMARATYKSIDGGATWMTSQFDSKMSINILKYDPTGSGELYVGFVK